MIDNKQDLRSATRIQPRARGMGTLRNAAIRATTLIK